MAADPSRPSALDAVAESLGGRIREERERSGRSLRGLAASLGVSPSLLSQIERGLVQPSVGTLWSLVGELGISLDELFADAGIEISRRGEPAVPPGSPVQRADRRKAIELAAGVRWERLTAEPEPGVDFVYVTYEVGASSSVDGAAVRHGGREYGYVIEGRLGIEIGSDRHELASGDSVSFDSARPHRLWNAGEVAVQAVWLNLGDSVPPH